MRLRTGKYAGHSHYDVQMRDPSYYRWMIENRPEMLVERKVIPKVIKQELTDEKLDERNNYNTLPKLGWDEAF